MKKLVVKLWLAFAILLVSSSAHAGEFAATGFEESLSKAIGETLGEGVLAEESLASIATKSSSEVTEAITSARSAYEDSLTKAGETAENITSKLQEFDAAVADLGTQLGKSFSLSGEAVTLSVGEDFTAALAAFGEKFKVDVSTIDSTFKGMDSKTLTADIKLNPPAETIPKTEAEAQAGEAAVDVKNVTDSITNAEQLLLDLQTTQKALVEAGADTAEIDAQIAAQKTVVENEVKKLPTVAEKLDTLQTNLKNAASEVKTKLADDIESLNTKRADLQTAQAELKAATEELDAAAEGAERDAAVAKVQEKITAVDEAQKAYDSAETEVWKNNKSSIGKSYEIAKANYNELKTSGTATEKDLLNAKETMDRARQMVKDEGTVMQRAKLYGYDILKDEAIGAIKTFFAGVIFMIPGIIYGYLENKWASNALLETIGRPQQFGDIYMQIPTELINTENPLASIFLYVGFPGGDCAAGTFEDGSCRMDETNIDATRDFYVSEGSSDFEGWATQPITSTGFSGKMIHLNTGYAFGADGQPTDILFPSKQLLSTDTQDDASLGAPVSIASFLENFAQVLDGSITVESFNTAAFWQGSKSSEVLGATEGETESETFMESSELAQIMSWYDESNTEKSCSIAGKSITPCPEVLQESLVGTIAAPLAWAGSGVNNVWPLRILNDSEIKQLDPTAGSLGGGDVEDVAMPAYGIYLYKTTLSALGKQLNDITGGNAAAGIEGLVADYVIALDENYNIVPMRTPQLQTGGPYGPTFKFAINPSVTKLYSFLNGVATKLDGTTETIATDLSSQAAYKAISSRAIAQINEIISWYPGAIKYGPFTVGGKKLTIDSSWADAGVYVYKIDPAEQVAGISGMLEDGGVDYLVALDESKNIIDLSSTSKKANEFLSLVTSRFYDANLKPYNSDNGYDDVQFQVLNCSGSYGVVTGTDVGSCTAVNLGTQSGPFLAPLYTLFMDADINPYNNPSLMSFTQVLSEQVGTSVSTLIESAMEQAGVTESMMQQLTSDQRTALTNATVNDLSSNAGDAWTTFAAALTDYQDKIAALPAGATSDSNEYQQAKSAQTVYNTAASDLVSYLQQNPSVFANLGTNLNDSNLSANLITALDNVQSQLASSAPRAVVMPTSSQQYVDAGLIPVQDQWGMSMLSSSTLSTVQSVVNAVYAAWKDFMVNSADQWALYLDKGPFSITPSTTLVPVTIEATSISDLASGVYIYTSPSLPGEFLVVGTTTSDISLGKKFEVLNKDDFKYLLSLSTGKMYSVGSSGLSVVADYTAKTPEQAIAFAQSTFPSISSDLVSAITNSQAAVIAARAAEEFSHSFYRFALLLDNQDADAGVFVYQDITAIPDAQTMDRTTLLGKVKDFFVYAEKQSDGTDDIGLEMPSVLNTNSRLISLVTGIIYSSTGPVGIYQNFQEPSLATGSTQQGAANAMWSIIADRAAIVGGTIRSALQSAVMAQLLVPIAQADQALADYKAATEEEDLTTQGYKLLTTSDVIAINAITPSESDPYAILCSASTTNNCMVSGAYPNLKLYNGKYYQVYQSYLSDVAQTVSDYAVSGGPEDIAIVYDVTYASDGVTVTGVSVNTVLTGELRDQARAAAGVIVSGGAQSLGIPNEQPGINASLLTPLTGFASQSQAFGTVDFYSYKQSAMAYISPTGGTPYYLDLYTGFMFDSNGRPISIGGKYAKSDDDRYLLVSRVSDGSVTSMLYEGQNGIAINFEVKDMDNNPTAPVLDSTGSYYVKNYTMQAQWDFTTNLKVVEYSPVSAGGTRYYQVYEQSALTYDSSNNELLYFETDGTKFTDAGNFREIQYATGKPADMILNPLSAYVVESSSGEDEAIFWQDTQSDTTGIIDYVVYKKSGSNYVANYSWVSTFSGTGGVGTATISFTDNLIDSAASSAYGVTIYYSQITDVDNNNTYKFVDKLSTIDATTMSGFLTLLGVSVAQDYQGTPLLVRNVDFSSAQTMNASSLVGNVYPASDLTKLADMFALATVKKVTATSEPDTKYFYLIGSSKVVNYLDTGFEYYITIGNGNYIDLETGVGYNATTGKPVGVAKLSELITLRDAVVHAGVQLLPQCQLTDSCSAGQEEPTKKVLSYMG